MEIQDKFKTLLDQALLLVLLVDDEGEFKDWFDRLLDAYNFTELYQETLAWSFLQEYGPKLRLMPTRR